MRVRRWSLALCILTAIVSASAIALTGCSEPLMSAEAEAVPYEPSGLYTATLTPRDGVSMDDLTAADLQVGYPIIDPEWLVDNGYVLPDDALEGEGEDETSSDAASVDDAGSSATAPSDEGDDAEEAPTSEATSNGDDESFVEAPTVTVYAEVRDFTLNDDGTATLSFEDPKASENLPEIYSVYSEKTEFSSQVPVTYPQFALEPDVPYVPATAETTKLTLVLDDGEFNPDVSKDAITLDGSFAGMGVESLSSAGRNLTLQLTGAPTMVPAAGVYTDGVVTVAPEAIAHASVPTNVTVPVQTDGVMLEAAGLEAEDGTVTIPMLVFGVADPATLTPEQVSVTGGGTAVTVKALQPGDDGRVTLTLDVPGATTANEAAAALTGQTLKVADFETTIDLPEAAFYPVFDYVGEDGDDLALTLIAYVNGGTLAEDLAPDDVALADGFEDGTVKSVERTGDTTAKIELAIPAGGVKPEDLDVTGTVTLSAGTLVSSWGEPTEEASSYTRSYSQESLGRDNAIGNILSVIENSNAFRAMNIASSVAGGYDTVMSILGICGVVEDGNAQILEELKSIEGQLNDVQTTLAVQSEIMRDLQKGMYENRCNGFDTALYRLQEDNQTAADYFALASSLGVMTPTQVQAEIAEAQSAAEAAAQAQTEAERQAQDQGSAEGSEGAEGAEGSEASEDRAPVETPTAPEVPAVENPYEGLGEDQAWSKYLTDLVQAMKNAEAQGNGNFAGFTKTMQTLESDYRTVANAVSAGSNSNNALYNYDHLCSLVYNFDTIAKPYRQAFRANVIFQLDRGLGFMSAYYNSLANPDNPSMSAIRRSFDAAQTQLENRAVEETTAIFFYTAGVYVDNRLPWGSRGSSYKEDDEAVIGWGNLTSENGKLDEFVKRMNGRTAREEVTLANFLTQWDSTTGNYTAHYNIDDLAGLGLNFYKQYEKRGSFKYDYDHMYADMIKWDETTLTTKYQRSRYRYNGGNPFLGSERYDIVNTSPSAFVKTDTANPSYI